MLPAGDKRLKGLTLFHISDELGHWILADSRIQLKHVFYVNFHENKWMFCDFI